ncbi:MAG: 16S rRNA (uracil(1498)-N(3))-methyltransferase [Bdellovibrionales bacterium]|nr:16S rRNA (uracil(1498)-N(3))-methyltransferase [Bdellovibrionales bacterium]
MNLFLLKPEETQQQRLTLALDDARAHHLISIKRVAPGDQVEVGVLGGNIGSAEVIAISKKQIEIELGAFDRKPPTGLSDVQLIVGVARPQIMKRVFYSAAMLGVGELIVTGADRSEASYFQSKLFSKEQFIKYLFEGMEQAMSTQIPRVRTFSKFHHLLREAPYAASSSKLLADTSGEVSLANGMSSHELNAACSVAIGPEGGWQVTEIKALNDAGFVSFNMGERILRVDTAAVAALAQLSLLIGAA